MDAMDSLEALGWDQRWEHEYAAGGAAGEPGRITSQERDRWVVRTASSEVGARIPSTAAQIVAPVVGDWVVVAPGPAPSDPVSIVALLTRRSAFSRGAAGGGSQEQVLAANIDLAWIVHGLDTTPNLRRLERYLALAWQSGASPSILLTKADLADELDGAFGLVRSVAIGVPIHSLSVHDAGSVARLRDTIAPGQTVVLLGPSGAGKSTLVNLLAGAELAATGQVRAGDRKGRHTTTRRQLFRLEGGALLIDTPGLRELRVWDLDEGLDRTYPDIAAVAERCRFADCQHRSEPGCAVLAAVAANELSVDRLDGYRKLQAEAAYARRQTDRLARKAAVSEHKSALKTMRFHHKRQGGA